MDKLKQVDPDFGLYATPPQPLPFGPSLANRAFLLQRDAGNILIYASETTNSEAMQECGGVDRHYLNHGHEAGFMSGSINAPLYCHEKDAPSVAKKADIAGTFTTQHKLDNDFEIIPTPGHTPGTTCYLWDNGAHRILFTGDMLHLHGDKWVVVVISDKFRSEYIKSLEHIRELDFDILMPWVSQEDKAYYAETNWSDTKARIDEIVERIQSSANH